MSGSAPLYEVSHELNWLKANLIFAYVDHSNRIHTLKPLEEHRQGLIVQAIVVEHQLRHKVLIEIACLTQRHTVLVAQVVIVQWELLVDYFSQQGQGQGQLLFYLHEVLELGVVGVLESSYGHCMLLNYDLHLETFKDVIRDLLHRVILFFCILIEG